MPSTPASIALFDANGQRVEWVRATDRATEATLEAVLAALQAIAPAGTHAAVTPSDSTVLTGVRSIYVGGGGNVVATVGGADVTYTAVPDGTTLIIKATKIKLATTATNIVAWG